MLTDLEIKQNIENILNEVALLEQTSQFNEKVVVVGASKTMPIECVKAVEGTSLFAVGENKAQELRDKYQPLSGIPWHFIGRLQTNKVKYVIDKVDLIHSVDSFEVLNEIERLATKHDKIQDVLLEVSICNENQKGGIGKGDIDKYLSYVTTLKHVKVKGLMTVMANVDDEGYLTEKFVELRQLFDSLKSTDYANVEMKWLSAGMSKDYALAIKCGANMIRLGTKIFGKRDYTV